jgi:hypothetical protein
MASVRAIEARRVVGGDGRRPELCIAKCGTGHNAPWSVGVEGLFRPYKIRGFVNQIAARWGVVAPQGKMGFQRLETVPTLAATAKPLIACRPRHLVLADKTPRVIVLPVTPPAAERIALIFDSGRKLLSAAAAIVSGGFAHAALRIWAATAHTNSRLLSRSHSSDALERPLRLALCKMIRIRLVPALPRLSRSTTSEAEQGKLVNHS